MSLDHIIEGLQSLALPIDQLKPDPLNARKHNKRNLDTIRASLERYGQVKPIAVRKSDMVVLCGNGRLQVAKELGWTHLACVQMSGSDSELKSFAIIDNQSSDLGEWDESALSDVLSSIAQDDSGLLDGLGFNQSELEALIDQEDTGELSDESIEQLGEPEQLKQTGSKDKKRKTAKDSQRLESRGSGGVEGPYNGGPRDPEQASITLNEVQIECIGRAQVALSKEKGKELSTAETLRILAKRYLKTVDRDL